MTPRFFQKIRAGKTFLVPFRREVPQPPTPAAVATFTRRANGRARAANRARNKRAGIARRANRR